jgi:hypothetical protein
MTADLDLPPVLVLLSKRLRTSGKVAFSQRCHQGEVRVMDKTEVTTYEGAAIPGSELQDAADDAMAEILKDPACRTELRRYGLDEEALQGVRFSVEQEPGIEPGAVITMIQIAAAGQLTAEGIKALWGMVLHRIRKRKGDDALGEER